METFESSITLTIPGASKENLKIIKDIQRKQELFLTAISYGLDKEKYSRWLGVKIFKLE